MGDSILPQLDATVLMNAAANGDQAAADQLLPLVYDQLRKAAQVRMNAERPDHTLSATALVHEAYLKLIGERQIPWASRQHFYVAAAEAMRRVLLDHAKSRERLKRGGGDARPQWGRVDFESLAELSAREPEEILSFEDALRRLEEEAPDSATVVRLRFFAGLTIDETAQTLGVSDRTVDRLWLHARAWLRRAIGESQGK